MKVKDKTGKATIIAAALIVLVFVMAGIRTKYYNEKIKSIVEAVIFDEALSEQYDQYISDTAKETLGNYYDDVSLEDRSQYTVNIGGWMCWLTGSDSVGVAVLDGKEEELMYDIELSVVCSGRKVYIEEANIVPISSGKEQI